MLYGTNYNHFKKLYIYPLFKGRGAETPLALKVFQKKIIFGEIGIFGKNGILPPSYPGN